MLPGVSGPQELTQPVSGDTERVLPATDTGRYTQAHLSGVGRKRDN